jgi:hypothetical protein
MERWYPDAIQNETYWSLNQLPELSSVGSSQQNLINIWIISRLEQEYCSSLGSSSGYWWAESERSWLDYETSHTDSLPPYPGEWISEMGSSVIPRWSMRWFSLRYFLPFSVFDYTRDVGSGGLIMDFIYSSLSISYTVFSSDLYNRIALGGWDSQRIKW